ncbi:MAG: lipoprotein insertase outer membrane protein LolB, partial [Casimicrobiaceae bacterium]
MTCAFVWRRGALLAAAVLLTACTQAVRVDTEAHAVADSPFGVTGRLSAHHASDALAANFNWQHRPDGDTIVLSTPLGQTLAKLARVDGGVTVALA